MSLVLSFLSLQTAGNQGGVCISGEPRIMGYSFNLGGKCCGKLGNSLTIRSGVFLTFGWHRDSAEGEHFADPVGMDEIEGDCYSYIRGCREKCIDRVRGILVWCISTSSQSLLDALYMHGGAFEWWEICI